MTKKYCAPEVAAQEKRNGKSDIFSLGCVYIEIAAALFLYSFVNMDLLQGRYYEQLAILPDQGFIKDGPEEQSIVRAVVEMDPAARPSAAEVVLTLRSYQKSPANFCPDCR